MPVPGTVIDPAETQGVAATERAAEDTAEKLHPCHSVSIVKIPQGLLAFLLIEAPSQIGIRQVFGGESLEAIIAGDDGLPLGKTGLKEKLVSLILRKRSGLGHQILECGDAVIVGRTLDAFFKLPVLADVAGGVERDDGQREVDDRRDAELQDLLSFHIAAVRYVGELVVNHSVSCKIQRAVAKRHRKIDIS